MDVQKLPRDRRRSASQFQGLVEHSLVGLAIIQDGRYLYVNPKYCTIFGYTRDELIYRLSPLDVVAEAERARVTERMETRLSGAVPVVEYTFKGRRKDGALIDVDVHGGVMEIGGRPALISSIMDVTEQRRTEAELRQLQAETRHERDTAQRYLDIAGVMILVLDRDVRVTLINREGCRILGYDSAEEIIGKLWIEAFIPARLRDELRDVMHRLQDGTEPATEYRENAVLTRTGEERLIAWHNTLIRDDEGAVIATLSSGEDVTERRRLDESLRLSEARFRSLFEGAPEAILVLELEAGRLADANKRAEALFECDRDELLRLGPQHFYAAEQPDGRSVKETFEAHGQRALAGEEVRFERRLRTAKGRERLCEVQLVSLASLEGKLVRASFVDVTEQRQAAERIHEDETQIRALLEQGVAAIFILEDDMTVGYQNRHFIELLGYAREEVVGQPLMKLVAEADRPKVAAAIADLLSGKVQSMQMPLTIKRRDGGLVDVLSDATVARFRGRTAIFGVAMDVTERSRAERDLQRTARTLKTLSQANAALVRAASEEELFREMCRVIVEVGGYRMAWIGLAEADAKKSVRAVASAGHDEGFIALARFTWADNKRGRTPVGAAIRTGMLQLNRDFSSNPLVAHLRAAALERGYGSSIGLPLRQDGRVFGVITIYASEIDAFNEDELRLLTELAGNLSFGSMSLRARTEREATMRHLERAMEETVQVVASTVEMRDSYTAGHQRRVTTIATAIAAEMGLSEDRIHGLRLAGIVHDLGKIHIPAEILSKPGRLTPLEYELIKTHPQVGYEILKPVAFPWPIADIVLQHHERLDGSGYPHGLKGEAILLEARILAVADVVESMITHRPYRAALGLERALAEIEQGRGRIYDAAAVDACSKLFRDGTLKLD